MHWHCKAQYVIDISLSRFVYLPCMAQHIIDISIRGRVVSCGAVQHYNRLRHTDVDADAVVAGGPFVSDLALPHAQFTFRFKLKTLVRCSRSSV